MTPVDIICLICGLLGVAFGLRCYYELWRWARLCQRSQVAVAFKRKTALTANFVEWMLWAQQLKPGEGGRVVYQNAGTRVAIIRGANEPSRILRALRRGKKKQSQSAAPRMAQGTWGKEPE